MALAPPQPLPLLSSAHSGHSSACPKGALPVDARHRFLRRAAPRRTPPPEPRAAARVSDEWLTGAHHPELLAWCRLARTAPSPPPASSARGGSFPHLDSLLPTQRCPSPSERLQGRRPWRGSSPHLTTTLSLSGRDDGHGAAPPHASDALPPPNALSLWPWCSQRLFLSHHVVFVCFSPAAMVLPALGSLLSPSMLQFQSELCCSGIIWMLHKQI